MMEKVLTRQSVQLLKLSLGLVLALYVVNYFLLSPLLNPGDFEHLSGYYELAWRFWRFSPGLPQYNPYLCGGRTLGADPQLPVFHPLILLVPILGAVTLVKLEMLAQLALGVYGLLGWLRLLNVPLPGRLWGILLFMAGGGVVTKFMVGHFAMGFYFLYPLFFYLSYKLGSESGIHRMRLRIAYWLLFIYAGLYKPNFIVYGVMPLLVETAIRAGLSRRWRVLVEFGVALLFCVSVNAASYLPAWKYFTDFPRLAGAEPRGIPFYSFLANILMPIKTLPKIFYGTEVMLRHEFNQFLGPIALVFVVWAFRKRFDAFRVEMISLTVFLLFSIWLGLGTFAHEFSLLHPYTWFYPFWPGFQSIRVPVRFWFGAYLALIIFSSLGFRHPRTKTFFRLFLYFGIIPLVGNAFINLSKPTFWAKYTQWSIKPHYTKEIELVNAEPNVQYRFLREGKAVIECSNNIQVYRSKELSEKKMLDADVLDSGSNSITPTAFEAKWENWSRFSVSATAPAPFHLVFNLNHSPYWHFRGKGKIVSHFGSRFTLASEDSEVEGKAVFYQPYVSLGMGISLAGLSLFLTYLLFVFYRTRKKIGSVRFPAPNSKNT